MKNRKFWLILGVVVIAILTISAGMFSQALNVSCDEVSLTSDGEFTCDGHVYDLVGMFTLTWSSGSGISASGQHVATPTPTPPIAVDDEYFIEKCARWQNVPLDVLDNDEFDSEITTIHILYDEVDYFEVPVPVYYYEDSVKVTGRNGGTGSFADLPNLVTRLSLNEVTYWIIYDIIEEIYEGGEVIEGVDFYYIDYKIENAYGLSNVATITMEIDEPMDSTWCDNIFSQTGDYYTVERVE